MKTFICFITSLAIFMGLLYLGITNYDLFAQYYEEGNFWRFMLLWVIGFVCHFILLKIFEDCSISTLKFLGLLFNIALTVFIAMPIFCALPPSFLCMIWGVVVVFSIIAFLFELENFFLSLLIFAVPAVLFKIFLKIPFGMFIEHGFFQMFFSFCLVFAASSCGIYSKFYSYSIFNFLLKFFFYLYIILPIFRLSVSDIGPVWTLIALTFLGFIVWAHSGSSGSSSNSSYISKSHQARVEAEKYGLTQDL